MLNPRDKETIIRLVRDKDAWDVLKRQMEEGCIEFRSLLCTTDPKETSAVLAHHQMYVGVAAFVHKFIAGIEDLVKLANIPQPEVAPDITEDLLK